jgi:hypothetical protein
MRRDHDANDEMGFAAGLVILHDLRGGAAKYYWLYNA